MKISKLVQSLVCLSLLAVLATGCARKHEDSDAHGEEHTATEHADEGVVYGEGKGLRVPKSTADYIGLKIADVEEQKIAPTFRFTAKIYRPSKSTSEAESRKASAAGFLRKEDAARLRIGQSVGIQVEGNLAMNGKVTALNREMEKANGQIEVLLEIDDARKPLAMGSYVEIAVPTGKEETTVTVPNTALLKTAEGNFVYTVSGEHLVRSEVKLGESNNDAVEIKDGLYAGDQIVVNPVMTLWMAELQSIRGGHACADGH